MRRNSSASGAFPNFASSRHLPRFNRHRRRHHVSRSAHRIASIAADFPLLAKAATWIGSIANQTRATLGGNLVNGSPAADSSPALLVYDAEIELISVRGKRRMPYANSTPATSKRAGPR